MYLRTMGLLDFAGRTNGYKDLFVCCRIARLHARHQKGVRPKSSATELEAISTSISLEAASHKTTSSCKIAYSNYKMLFGKTNSKFFREINGGHAAFNAERGPNDSIYYSRSHFGKASLYTIRDSARIISTTFAPAQAEA